MLSKQERNVMITRSQEWLKLIYFQDLRMLAYHLALGYSTKLHLFKLNNTTSV